VRIFWHALEITVALITVPIARAIWKRRGRPVVLEYDGETFTHYRKGRPVSTAVFLALCLALTVAYAASAADDSGVAAAIPVVVVCLALTAVIVWRTWVTSVTVGAEEIRVRNFRRDYRIRWSEVAAITRKDSRLGKFVAVFATEGNPLTVRLELRNGKTVYVSATAVLRATPFSTPDVRILRALEEHAQAHGVNCDELDSTALAEMGLI
jgi:hypothetical protein